jgi:hypothetical protein
MISLPAQPLMLMGDGSSHRHLFESATRDQIMDQHKLLEWTGVSTAILYSMLIALNIGAEFVGFSLLLISAFLIGLWAYFGRHRGILFLQVFYASAGLIGMLRWF